MLMQVVLFINEGVLNIALEINLLLLSYLVLNLKKEGSTHLRLRFKLYALLHWLSGVEQLHEIG
jgi:hypothetical protein